MRTTNENERILANLGETERTWQTGPNRAKPGKTGQKTGIFRQKRGKTGQKTGEIWRNRAKNGQKRAKMGKRNRTLAKQGETESFAEFWFGIAQP